MEIPDIAGTYKALQFHIHTSSEHTINGEHFGAELHVVHQEVNGNRFAVVGMMIQPTAAEEHALFQQLLDGWQTPFSNVTSTCFATAKRQLLATAHKARRLDSTFTPYELIPVGSTMYFYDGGLTTPPCSEVVWWNLADKPVEISPAQYNQLVTLVLDYLTTNCTLGTSAGPAGSTSRPVQPLNGRTIERICPVGYQDALATSDAGRISASLSAMGVIAFAVLSMVY